MALDRLHLRKRRRQILQTKFNMLFAECVMKAYRKGRDNLKDREARVELLRDR